MFAWLCLQKILKKKDFEQFVGNLDDKNHNYYLDLAYQLAEQNLGKTGLNPSVGAIVVKDDNVISSGITRWRETTRWI